MVFYRKYRPQNFEELIGQDHVKKTLLAASAAGKLGHAYLFCGPRGSGKTSSARILAKIVNCLATEGSLPCNKCGSCTSITEGSSLDLIEIDAASNRGIDDIRDLREKIKLTPSSLKKKVYIIDEVHMLTSEAFNALLKTLEEPPAHVLFILATTEVHKLPQTILSRVQRFDFKSAGIPEIRKALSAICEKEKLSLSNEIITLIAECADGSFRDAVKLLDQIVSMGDISVEEVRIALAANDFSQTVELLDCLTKKDTGSALYLIGKIIEKGVSPKEFITSVLRVLRQLLLIKNNAEAVIKDETGTQKFEILKSLASKSDSSKIISYIENFQSGLEQLKYTTLPSLPLEAAVVKSASGIEKRAVSQEIPVFNAPVAVSAIPPVSPEPIPSFSSSPPSDDAIVITDKWTYILETIKPYNYSLEALLKQAKVVNCDNSNVILEVPYSFHQRILEAPKSRTLLESVLADVLGKTVRVSTVLGKREIQASELANVEVAQDDEIVRLASEIFNS
jgi:DNA polymerase III subunit gamma/tau